MNSLGSPAIPEDSVNVSTKKTDVGEISSKYSPKIYEIIRRIVKVESGAVRNHVNLADFFL